MTQHIALALSGGVDSAVTGLILKQRGLRLTAFFMQNWSKKHDAYCSSEQDLSDARMVADQLDIPLEVVDFSKEYWDRVFAKCLDEFAKGRTPNPDVLCNQEIKFACLLEHTQSMGADALATGHYAQIKHKEGIYELHQGLDPNKDQSYFLYRLNQFQLQHALFPLGEMHKTEVRQIATDAGLVNHNKKDSTGICFIGERHFKSFLKQYLIGRPGVIRSDEGKIIGQHDGVIFYTLGQRKGLNIGGIQGYSEEPWFVIRKDCDKNELIVAQGTTHPNLFCQQAQIESPHWIGATPKTLPLQLQAKTRYRQAHQDAILDYSAKQWQIDFAQPQRAVTSGQSLVLYNDTLCLGGGIII